MTSPKKKKQDYSSGQKWITSARVVSNKPSTSLATSSAPEALTNDAILAMPEKLDDLNKALSQRLDRVEQKSFVSIPVNHRPLVIDLQREELQCSPQVGTTHHHDTTRPIIAYPREHTRTLASWLESRQSYLLPHVQEVNQDVVLPNVETLHCLSSVTDAVYDVLASYVAQA